MFHFLSPVEHLLTSSILRGRGFGAVAMLCFIGCFTSTAARAAAMLVPQGAVWKYLDDGSDQGTGWLQPGFGDSSWASGSAQLGYGDGDEATVIGFGPDAGNKYVTTYFRHAFNVANPSAYTSLQLEVQRDDGVVVYLNGTEVWRDNMPSGTINSSTLASTAVGGTSETLFLSSTVASSLLVSGANVLAVEIHQANGTSSDISFDLSLTGNDAAGTITRGPYLQQGTSDSMILRWRTDLPTDSWVRYGTDPGNLGTTVTDPAVVSDHLVQITGLQPGTVYYYQLGGSTGWFSADLGDFFVTSPPPGTPHPTRVWVIGDSGTANADAAAVRDAFLGFSVSQPADLWLMLGDNAYNSGTDSEYQAAVFDMYPALLQNTVLWPTRGNHESDSGGSGSTYYNIFTLPVGGEAGGLASGTEAYYSFDHANIHFVCLDSQGSSRSSTGPMATWLQNDLAATLQDWIIAFWHHPPYTKGSHNSDSEGQLIDMRGNILPIIEAGGVDLVLCGHSHSYERSFLLDGHYGSSSSLTQGMKVDGGDGREDGTGAYAKPAGTQANAGVVYTVAGNAGKISGGSLNHPAMFISLNVLGSVVLDVDGNRLDATLLQSNGSIGDYYTLTKGTVTPTPPAAPSGLIATAAGDTQIDLAWADNANNEDGFEIERSTDGVNFSLLATVGANVTDGADVGLIPDTTYWYRVRAFNGAGDSAYSNVAEATTETTPIETPLIAAGAVWRFLDDGSDQGSGWRQTGFNDAAWASGPAQLGYGDGDEVTVVSFGPNSGAKYITTYFRYSFNLADASVYTDLTLDLLRDDGAVVYINATEVHRSNMPGGSVDYLTQASSAIGGGDENTFQQSSFSASSLVTGLNVVAVEIHQTSGTSSDISFDLRLTALGEGGGGSGDVAPPGAVTSLSVAGVTTTAISLIWNAPGDDGQTGTAAFYDIRYSSSPIDESNWSAALRADGEPTPAPAGTSQGYTLQGLTPGMTYYVGLKTSDEANNVSPLSNVAIATTDLDPPTAPTGLTATAVSSAQINLDWTDTSSGENGFRVERSQDGVNFAAVASTGANTASFEDRGLTSSTLYYYRIVAFNAAGDSSPSNVSSATTQDPAPTIVTFLSLKAEDGWVRESSEGSDVGGSAQSSGKGSAGLRLGDDKRDRQYKSILSFDTSSLPEGAVITSVTLRLLRGRAVGTNPFQTHGLCHVDIQGGAGLSGSTSLSSGDFQALADGVQVAVLSDAPSNGDWSEGNLSGVGLSLIDTTGTTQFRIYFDADDNDDRSDDYIGYYPADESNSSRHPQLVVTYQ